MLVDKTYSFYCNDLNSGKYNILHDKALTLRDFKNEISLKVCSDPIYYFNKPKFDWITLFRPSFSGNTGCNNQDIAITISDIYVAYDNKHEQFKKKTSVKIQKEITKSVYKRNGKNFKKGDLKDFQITKKSTKFTTIVSYLTKYYHDGLIKFLKENKTDDENKEKFRNDILNYLDKYGDTLLNLVKRKQQRIIKEVFRNPIEFKSLTFTSCTEQKQNIISKNKRTSSVYNSYITLPGQPTSDGKIHIPTKHSRKHHGKLKHYYKKPNKKGQRNNSYKIIFGKENTIRVALSYQKEETIVLGKTNAYGVDTNVKHNLFADKYGNNIDYDRKLFNEYVSFLKKCDNKLANKPKKERKLSERDYRKKQQWMKSIKDMLKRKSSDLVKQAISLGKDHIIMEDLQLMGKSFITSEDLQGFKYSRLMGLLNLSNLKNIVSSVANKHGLQSSFVQPHYTSKCCDHCGHIHDDNRITQEKFECVRCGNSHDADTHSAKLIEDRYTLDVLRLSLLTFIPNKGYSPKKLNKQSIKNILIECYDSNGPNGPNDDILQ